MGSLFHSHMWFCVFNCEITKVSFLLLFIILWRYGSAVSLCFTKAGVLHKQGLMVDQPLKLATKLVWKDRLPDYRFRNDLEFKELT